MVPLKSGVQVGIGTMHRLVNCRSNDLSSSSKTSRNIVSSPLSGRRGDTKGDKGNVVIQDHTMQKPPPNRQPPNPPQDLNQYYDTSDTDDCESVGSNSPALDVVNETYNNNKNLGIGKTTSIPSIHGNKPTMEENPTNIHGRTINSGKVNKKKIGDGGNQGAESTHAIPHEMNQPISSKTYIARSNKEPLIGGSINALPLETPNSLNKMVSRIGKTNQGSKTRDALVRDTPRVKNNNTKRYKSSRNIEKHDDNIYFDKGDGGGFPANSTTSEPHINTSKNNNNTPKSNDNIYFNEGDGEGPSDSITTGQAHINMYSSNNNRKSHLTQEKNENFDLESFDEGDGGGFYPHPSAKRSYLKEEIKEQYRRRMKHEMQSRRGSTSRSSRARESHKGSRRGRRSRGSSRSRSSGSSGSRRSKKGRRRKSKSRGGSHRSSSRTSHHSGKSYHSSGTWVSGLSALRDTKPYPSKWRCFGRRPPAIHEFRPLGEGRVKNVRPAGKLGYLMQDADAKRGCQGKYASDAWDTCYGLAKPITDEWSTPLPYGTQIVRVGDIDPFFHPSRGDIIIINPAQTYYRAVKSGYVLTYHGRDYLFGVGDLIVRMGRFMPNGEYIPYGNLELYMHTQTREMRLLGRQPFLLVDFNYYNLDYESPGKHLKVGTFLNEYFFPRRGDIIICGGAWAENYPNAQRKHHSSVKYWRPRMEFLPNDMLLRPYVDIGRKVHRRGRNNFYWGATELYSYSGKGLAWAYWGRDHHICDTPYPREQEHGIKTGHHKDEVGHYGDYGVGFSHGHQGNDDCHSEHNRSHMHRPHGHQGEDDCHREHELSQHR